MVVVQAGFGIKILARVAQIERDRAGGFGVAVRGDGPFPNRGVVTCAAQEAWGVGEVGFDVVTGGNGAGGILVKHRQRDVTEPNVVALATVGGLFVNEMVVGIVKITRLVAALYFQYPTAPPVIDITGFVAVNPEQVQAADCLSANPPY